MGKDFRKIIQYNDSKFSKVLREPTKEIKSIDTDIKKLFKDLVILSKENSKEGITLVGLSAPQVGLGVSAFVYFDISTEKYIEVINPKLVYFSKESSTEWEGCASVGSWNSSLFGPVQRPRSCQIEFIDINGEERKVSATNFQGHIIQHEIDHLNGVLFLDRVSDPKLILTAAELDEYAKKNNGRYPKV